MDRLCGSKTVSFSLSFARSAPRITAALVPVADKICGGVSYRGDVGAVGHVVSRAVGFGSALAARPAYAAAAVRMAVR